MVGPDSEQGVARFRLRFLLHEIDLNGPEVVIGRSPDCHVTIEDPLVSREHARIRIDTDGVLLSDLNSRNGVQVNGRVVRGEVPLQDGDRIRLGTQELVFAQVSYEPRSSRSTGCIVTCGVCQIPYPEEASHCPHCGAVRRDDDTMSGLVVDPEGGWTLQLMFEAVRRAVAAERPADAERMMQRLAAHLERELTAGRTLQESVVAQASELALSLLPLSSGSAWLEWMLKLHVRTGLFPNDDVVQEVESLRRHDEQVAALVGGFLMAWEREAFDFRRGDAERWARLRQVEAATAAAARE